MYELAFEGEHCWSDVRHEMSKQHQQEKRVGTRYMLEFLRLYDATSDVEEFAGYDDHGGMHVGETERQRDRGTIPMKRGGR